MFEDDEHTMMVASFADGTFFADRYRIVEVLGSGAMGKVYRAEELSGGRRVALKVLHPDRLADNETVERFRREANVLASIGHPCIVQIHAFHHTREGIPFLAMELLEGVTLKTRLQQGRFEDLADLQEIVDGICGALAAAHSRGVVHRDLKPDNIFLPATGVPRAKLVDFGLSRIAKADKSLTHSGMILGTPRYMPPEQIRDASEAGPEGDLYSLGVIVYECLAGKSPYPALDYGQLLGCLLEGRTIPFSDVRPDLPTLAPVLTRALAHDPAHRFSSAAELADAFGAAIGRPSQREAIAAQVIAAPEPSRHRLSHPSPMPSKSSTLAFDPAAGRQLIAAIEAARPVDVSAPLPADDTHANFVSDAPTNPEVTRPDPAPPVAPSELDKTSPTPAGEVPMIAQVYPGTRAVPAGGVPAGGVPAGGVPVGGVPVGGVPVGSVPVGSVPVGGVAPGPAPSPYGAPIAPVTAPAPTPAPAHAPPAMSGPPPSTPPPRGGDTLFLSEGAPPPPMPYAPGPHSPYPGQPPGAASGPAPPGPAFSSAAPQTAPKKSRLGLILFLVAVVIVIIVSAAGGFALRAILTGQIAF